MSITGIIFFKYDFFSLPYIENFMQNKYNVMIKNVFFKGKLKKCKRNLIY